MAKQYGPGLLVMAAFIGPGTAATASKAGADVVLDYSGDDLAQAILTENNGAFVDRIVEVEFGLNAAVDAEVITPNGTIAAYGSAKEMTPTLAFGPMSYHLFLAAKTLCRIKCDPTSLGPFHATLPWLKAIKFKHACRTDWKRAQIKAVCGGNASSVAWR